MIRKFLRAAGLCALIAPMADATTVSVPEKSQPESITIAPDGDLILGSAASPKIYRAKQGSGKTEVFVDVGADGAVTFLGVLADAPTNTLWACQIYTAPPGSPPHSALRGFDLKTGAAKFRWELPGEKNLCNDFVIGPDKALYISDTLGAKIWRLKPGAAAPELFSDDRTLFGVDGITFIGTSLYENNVIFNKLYRVPIDAGGHAGKPVDIWMDMPVKGPDGMRAANGKLFLAENGAGKIDVVTVNGDSATVTVLQDGLATPTAIEPAGDTLWYGERAGDRAHSMPLPKDAASDFALTGTDRALVTSVPLVYTAHAFGCTGGNTSPELQWSGAPTGTLSFMVTLFDPDERSTPSGWWHWIVYDLPAVTKSLPKGAGVLNSALLPAGALQGRSDLGENAYHGPCPAQGDPPHRYTFTIYALNVAKLPVPPDSSGGMVTSVAQDHLLGKAVFVAHYGRPK